MINYRKILLSFHKYNDISLLIIRTLPAYYMFINHGLSKITNPAKWDRYGTFFTKYFEGFLDFANIPFGFMAAFAESICAILVLIGLFALVVAVFGSLVVVVFQHLIRFFSDLFSSSDGQGRRNVKVIRRG